MNRKVVLLASVAAVLALLAFILWDSFHAVPEGSIEPTETPEVLVRPTPVATAVATAPPVRRKLAITGRVVGSSLEALGGLRIACGDELTTTDSSGAFSLPRALRPRTVLVRLSRGGKELSAWDGVIAGDPPISTVGGAGAEAGEESSTGTTFSVDADMVPALPEKLRWTVNITQSGPVVDGAAADRGKNEGDETRWIQIDDTFVEEWGNGVRARIRGRTRLPDSAHVAASLYFDGLRAIATLEPAAAKSSEFEAALYSPADARFYSGVFEARASFNSVLESFSTIESWKQSRPEVDWETLTIPEVTRNVFSGDPAESREEDLAARAYYTQRYDDARRLERSIKSTLLSRSDEVRVFVEGKGLSPRSVQSGPRAWFRGDFLDSQDHLDEAKWRKFLDEEWRPEIRALAKEHSTRGQEKYMTASTLLNGLLDALLDESYGYSKFVVYPAFNLESHPNDFYPDEERAGDLVRLGRVVAAGFEGLERFRHLAE